MALTENTAHALLNHTFRNIPLPSPEKVYVGLFNASGELSASGYTRQEITFGEPSAGVIKNDKEVRFPIAAEDWGEVTGAGVFDAVSAGSRLDESQMVAVRIVRVDDQFVIPVGNYSIIIEKLDGVVNGTV